MKKIVLLFFVLICLTASAQTDKVENKPNNWTLVGNGLNVQK